MINITVACPAMFNSVSHPCMVIDVLPDGWAGTAVTMVAEVLGIDTRADVVIRGLAGVVIIVVTDGVIALEFAVLVPCTVDVLPDVVVDAINDSLTGVMIGVVSVDVLADVNANVSAAVMIAPKFAMPPPLDESMSGC